jgi:hypothetical protein
MGLRVGKFKHRKFFIINIVFVIVTPTSYVRGYAIQVTV